MNVWALIPVKPFAQAKSRLASVLSPAERHAFSRALLSRTLDVLGTVRSIEQILVISRDPEALALARDHAARALAEPGILDLNAALHFATETAQAEGARAVLIVPSDLPLLSAAEVEELIGGEATEPQLSLAPDRRGTGTNALLLRPPNLIQYQFGEDSFREHLAQAAQLGLEARVCHLPSVAWDVDVPEDLAHIALSNL